MSFSKRLNDEDKTKVAYKKFGRGKSVGISFYKKEEAETGYCYVHIRDIGREKQVSLGIDELETLAEYKDEILELSKEILRENGQDPDENVIQEELMSAFDDEEDLVPLVDLRKKTNQEKTKKRPSPYGKGAGETSSRKGKEWKKV